MTDYSTLSDDELLRLLHDALAGADAVPPEVVAMAKAAPDLASLDLASSEPGGLDWELALLVHDSAQELVGVRGDGSGRQLDFEGRDADLVVIVGAAAHATTTELSGQVVPGSVVTVEVVRAGAVLRSAVTDELGRFRIADLPAGPLRLRVPGVRLLTPVFDA